MERSVNRDETRRPLTDADRAALGRRQALRLGGATVLGAAVLAACGSSEDPGVVASGTTEPASDATTTASVPTTSDAEGEATNLVLVRTATSLSLLAVDFYQLLIDGDVDVPLRAELVALATRCQDHHRDHAERLSELTRDLGGDPVTTANEHLQEVLVDRARPTLTSEGHVTAFAGQVEDVITSTHAYAGGTFSDAELRQAALAIGAATARHAAAWHAIGDPTAGAPRAFIDASGVGRVPDEALLTDEG